MIAASEIREGIRVLIQSQARPGGRPSAIDNMTSMQNVLKYIQFIFCTMDLRPEQPSANI